MNNPTFFVSKILIISTLISILIKYGGPFIPLKANNYFAISLVFLPSLILGLILYLRRSNLSSTN